MLENIWNNLKIFFTSHDQHTWLEHHLLYFSILGGTIVITIIVLILIRINKDIKRINKNARDKAVDYMRETSQHNKKERKQLKF